MARAAAVLILLVLIGGTIGCGDDDDHRTSAAAHIWALGESDAIVVVIRSDDRGATWQAQATFPMDERSTIDFADTRVGWVLGSRILRTTDGGASWEERPRRRLLHVGDVKAFDGQRALIVGNTDRDQICGGDCPSDVSSTDDGGVTWTPSPIEPSPPQGVLRSVCITRRGTGVAAGTATFPFIRNAIVVTSDFGASWTRADDPLGLGSGIPISGPPGPPAASGAIAPVAVACADDHRVWVAGTRHPTEPGNAFALVRSDDGGRTWHDLSSGTPPAVTVDALAFVGADEGSATVHDDEGGARILRTADGGESWHAAAITIASSTLPAIAFAGRTGVAAGAATIDGVTAAAGFLSEDRGANWTPLTFPADVHRILDVAVAR